MHEPRRQLRLAQEALQQVVPGALPIVQHLDDDLAAERRLRAAIHPAEAALADQLADDEISDVSPEQAILVRHPGERYTCEQKIACVRGENMTIQARVAALLGDSG